MTDDAAIGAEGYSGTDNGQLQEEDTLIRGDGDDVLGEDVEAVQDWSAAERFGNTVDEQREGETLEQRLDQERADADAEVEPDLGEETVQEELDEIDEELAEGGELDAVAEQTEL